MEINSWLKSHFCAYLLLSMAKIDGILEQGEVDKTQHFLERMHLNAEDSLPIIKEVWNGLKNTTEQDRLDYIAQNYSKYFSNSEEIEAMMDEIEELILADFNIEKTEIKFYAKMRKAVGARI